MRHLLCIAGSIFFLTIQIGLWILGTTSGEEDSWHGHSFGDKFYESYDKRVDLLIYHHLLDRNEEVPNIDPSEAWKDINIMDEDLWNVKCVLGHRVRNGQVEVKCQWKDPNESNSWIDMSDCTVLYWRCVAKSQVSNLVV